MSRNQTILWEYPNAVAHEREDGTIIYTVEMTVGGCDEAGDYGIVLEGPAEGEKYYY